MFFSWENFHEVKAMGDGTVQIVTRQAGQDAKMGMYMIIYL